MKPVHILGAGFSGLTLAYHLRRLGMEVAVFEKQDRAGGLLRTHKLESGLAETAANAFLADVEIEKLFEELGVPFAEVKPAKSKRYIFWEKPRRWPLTPWATAKLVWLAGQWRFNRTEVSPRPGESIYEWVLRTGNAELEERLISPALQGIYAGDPKRLSASLVLSGFMGPRLPKGRWRGSVSPKEGMEQLISALLKKLKDLGVAVHFNHDYAIERASNQPVVLCTPAWTAAEILRPAYPDLSEQLQNCESLPLVSATCFFPPSSNDLEGFGCLFPVSQDFRAKGVIFNTCVFSNRLSSQKDLRSETWILGGALNLGAVALTDQQLTEQIIEDRSRLFGAASQTPVEVKVTRWPRAIPHYTIQWEKILNQLKVPRPIFLHGNYLGAIGLSRIHQRSLTLARQLKEEYGS